MYLKKLLVTLVLVLLSLLMLPSGITVANNTTQIPHEDPKIAEFHFDAIAILGHYSDLLDNVLARRPTQVESLSEKRPSVNIPEGLGESLDSFGNASVHIAWLIPEIEAGIENMNELGRQFRLEEMEAQRQQSQGNLSQAYGQLSVIEYSAVSAGNELGVPPPGSSHPVRVAYEELESRIVNLRSLLNFFKALLETLPEQESLLLPTRITLAIEPTIGFVGDRIHFEGILTSAGTGLPNREVVLLLDGVPHLSSRTGPGGSYQGRLQIPYTYVPSLSLQALYYPQGEDVGLYLASRSPAIDIEVLFYTATLQLEIKGKSYPGLDSTLHGRFDYGDQPIPSARDTQIYLDKKLVRQAIVGNSFEQNISLEPEISLGKHMLVVVAPPQNRYASVDAAVPLDVIQATTIIDVSPPRVAIMPFAVSLEGRIYSEVGPVDGAVVEASLGNREAQAITSAEGEFKIKLGTGMGFSLIGSQNLGLNVNPREPWNSAASSSWSLVAINPILIGVVALALGLIMAALAKRLRIKPTGPLPEGVTMSPEVVPTEPVNAQGAPASFPTRHQREVKAPRQITFELYRRLLRLIQDLTSIVLKPQLTLREFATQCAPLLGPAYNHLDQFTRLIERLLYSKHPADPADLDKGRELGKLLEESLTHDRP